MERASDARMTRGLEISKNGTIRENEDGSFTVPSQTSKDVSYEVRLIYDTWVCDCPDFENRADRIEICKHAHAVKFWIAANTYLKDEPKPRVFSDDATRCDRCGSIRVIQFGKRAGKQVYYCNDCRHKFTPSLLKKAKYSPEFVSLTLDLYFSGMSFTKIARSLNDNFHTNLGGASVYRWTKRFVPMISEYVNSLTPQLSETWHADELFVKTKGGITHKKSKNMAFLWNVMDRKTRFLIASKLSKARDTTGATLAFQEAIKNAHDSQPERIFTDSLNSYNDAIRFGFKGQVQHIVNAGISKPHATNNRIERLNGTLRERAKVQRGWKKMDTPIPEGQRIHYNFVKPHMALEGQTPAQRAEINLPKGKGKWLDLLEFALTNRPETTR